MLKIDDLIRGVCRGRDYTCMFLHKNRDYSGNSAYVCKASDEQQHAHILTEQAEQCPLFDKEAISIEIIECPHNDTIDRTCVDCGEKVDILLAE